MDSPGTAALPSRAAIVATFPVRTQDELARRLDPPLFRRCRQPEAWTTVSADDRRYHDFDDELARELRQAGPHFVAELGAAGLLPLLPEQVCHLSATFDGRPVTLRLSSGEIGVTPVGYGTLRLVYDVLPGGPGGPEMVDLSLGASLEDDLDQIVLGLVCDLEVDGDSAGGSTPELVSALPCLWAHVLYLFEAAEVPELAGLAPVADESSADVHGQHASVRAGLGSSLVAGGDHATFATALRVLSLVSAYYAALADVDRRVFSCLVAWRRRGTSPGTAPVLADDLFEEVSVFQAVLQTLDLHLAASMAFEVRVWAAMSRVWRMDQQLGALTDKLAMLRTFQERETERAGLARSARLTAVALAFTVLSFLGVLLDLVQFGQDDPLVVPEATRSALSVLFIAAVSLAFVLGVRQRRR